MECPPDIKELLKLLYNLSGSETEVMYYLCDKEARATEIADSLEKIGLRFKGIFQNYVLRDWWNVEARLKKGKKGRYYIYAVPDKEELKQKIKQRLDDWEENKLKTLEDL